MFCEVETGRCGERLHYSQFRAGDEREMKAVQWRSQFDNNFCKAHPLPGPLPQGMTLKKHYIFEITINETDVTNCGLRDVRRYPSTVILCSSLLRSFFSQAKRNVGCCKISIKGRCEHSYGDTLVSPRTLENWTGYCSLPESLKARVVSCDSNTAYSI